MGESGTQLPTLAAGAERQLALSSFCWALAERQARGGGPSAAPTSTPATALPAPVCPGWPQTPAAPGPRPAQASQAAGMMGTEAGRLPARLIPGGGVHTSPHPRRGHSGPWECHPATASWLCSSSFLLALLQPLLCSSLRECVTSDSSSGCCRASSPESGRDACDPGPPLSTGTPLPRLLLVSASPLPPPCQGGLSQCWVPSAWRQWSRSPAGLHGVGVAGTPSSLLAKPCPCS